jgi:hypothetical protein
MGEYLLVQSHSFGVLRAGLGRKRAEIERKFDLQFLVASWGQEVPNE